MTINVIEYYIAEKTSETVTKLKIHVVFFSHYFLGELKSVVSGHFVYG